MTGKIKSLLKEVDLYNGDDLASFKCYLKIRIDSILYKHMTTYRHIRFEINVGHTRVKG